MKTRTLIGAALLLSTAGLGVALAAARIDPLVRPSHGHDAAARADARPQRLADNDQPREHSDRHSGRYANDGGDDDDDDDDDDRSGGRPGAPPQNRAADPAAPVPDNGLFQGKARPKVEVQ